MTTLLVIAVAVVAIVAAKGAKKSNGKFFGSSTSMLFGNPNMNAGAAC